MGHSRLLTRRTTATGAGLAVNGLVLSDRALTGTLPDWTSAYRIISL